MTLTPIWRTRIFATGSALLAGWLSIDLARGELFWPLLCTAALLGVMLSRWQPLPIGTVLLGALLFGYIVGNRGFAQISLAGSFPLLPGEAVLAVAGGVLLWQSAWRHELPVRRDPLNLALLAWIVIGSIRVAFDVRVYGFMAVRDFATVYYAGFFYLAQAAARDPASRRFLSRTLVVSLAILLPVYEAFTHWPGFFIGTLTLRGAPVIFFKDDLAGTFLAVGSVLFFLRHEAGGSRWNVALSLVFAAATLESANRASMLGLFAAAGWLALRGRWRFAAVQAVGGAVAVTLILLGAAAANISWHRTPVYGLYDRLASLADPEGRATYTSRDSSNKGDNNRFRLVWWTAVVDETLDANPYVGLGFGYDLADRFLREYYSDNNEEFSARSPHNILLTLFARTGAIGLAAFLVVLVAMARETWRAVGAGPGPAALWCAAWTILISACLGVVLEGPMGAVVFWTILGLAHGTAVATATDNDDGEPAEDAEKTVAALPTSVASVSGDRTLP